MREIKFRAFNGNEMFFWKNEYKENDFWEYVQYPKTINVMQYIGKSDKNGNDIYEGDIVRYVKESCLTSIETYSDDKLVVKYCSEECKFIMVDKNCEVYRFPFIFKEYEIIGNICENPKLAINFNKL